jgi:hypothetical protein
MKNSRRTLTGIVFLLFDLLLSLIWAPAADLSSGNLDPVAGLELVAPKDVPKYATFWFLRRPGSPPVPCNSFPELPVYWLNKERKVFLLDDRLVDWNAVYQQRLAARLLKAAALGMSLAELELMESGGPYEAYSYSTNDLWLEITEFANCTASLVIHRPWDDTNAYHDLFYTTNLAAPIDWHFVQRCVSTNVSVPGLGDAQGFFRLGQTNGSLTVATSSNAQALAEMLVPPWVIVSSATNIGALVARGTFAGGHGCGLPLETGVILCSGNIGLAAGSNDISSAGLWNVASADADLDKLVMAGGDPTFNAAALEFDIVWSNSFVLQFQYIFASEEYPEYLGGTNGYNDPMAIFVSTNYDGTNWIIAATNNIALVSGTNQHVSVNTINGGGTNKTTQIYIPPSNPQFYVDNGDPDYSTNAPVFNVQYDGTTVLLTAQIQVPANVIHHIKLGIEDYGDGNYDSAVLIKEWSPGPCCQCQ